MWRKWLLGLATGLIVAFFATPARADQRIYGNCAKGNTTVNSQGILSTNVVIGSFPSCTVTVFVTNTITLATIYQDNSRTPLSNPFTAASDGSWFFYAASGSRDDVQMSGGGLASPVTLGDILAIDLTVGPVLAQNALSFSSTPTFAASSFGVFSMTLTGNVTSSTITGGSQGQEVVFSLCQDGTGGRTFTWPVSFLNPPTVDPTASACGQFGFILLADNKWHMIMAGEAAAFPSASIGRIATTSGAVNATVGATTPNTGVFTTLTSPVNSLQRISAIRMADQFTGASADIKIQNAINDLPPTGGVVDARGFGATAQTIANPILIGSTFGQVNIQSISLTGNVVTVIANNTYTGGDPVTVTSVTVPAVNGSFTVSTASSTQFTYPLTHANIVSTSDPFGVAIDSNVSINKAVALVVDQNTRFVTSFNTANFALTISPSSTLDCEGVGGGSGGTASQGGFIIGAGTTISGLVTNQTTQSFMKIHGCTFEGSTTGRASTAIGSFSNLFVNSVIEDSNFFPLSSNVGSQIGVLVDSVGPLLFLNDELDGALGTTCGANVVAPLKIRGASNPVDFIGGGIQHSCNSALVIIDGKTGLNSPSEITVHFRQQQWETFTGIGGADAITSNNCWSCTIEDVLVTGPAASSGAFLDIQASTAAIGQSGWVIKNVWQNQWTQLVNDTIDSVSILCPAANAICLIHDWNQPAGSISNESANSMTWDWASGNTAFHWTADGVLTFGGINASGLASTTTTSAAAVLSSLGQVKAGTFFNSPAGTDGAPAYTSVTDNTTGLSFQNAGQMAISLAGAAKAVYVPASNEVPRLGSGQCISWSSNTNPRVAGQDIIICRSSAGIISINGTPAIGGTFTVRNGANSGTCTFTFVSGILTAETC